MLKEGEVVEIKGKKFLITDLYPYPYPHKISESPKYKEVRLQEIIE